MLKASKEFTQDLEKLITRVRREEAAAVAKKTQSKFTEKVPGFRFPAAHKAQRYVMENK